MKPIMFNPISGTLFLLLVSAAPVLAQFGGVLKTKTVVTSKDGKPAGSGTNIFSVAKSGVRLEMNTKLGLFTVKAAMLWRIETPNVLYRLDDRNKTYKEIDLTKAQEVTEVKDSRSYTVEKRGEETILGHVTEHVLVRELNARNSNGWVREMWIAKRLIAPDVLSKMTSTGDKALRKALKDADLEGLPLKALFTSSDGAIIKTEPLRIDEGSVPSSTFEIPPGYTKTGDGKAASSGD